MRLVNMAALLCLRNAKTGRVNLVQYPKVIKMCIQYPCRNICLSCRKGGKDQESIQSSTTTDQGYHMGQ